MQVLWAQNRKCNFACDRNTLMRKIILPDVTKMKNQLEIEAKCRSSRLRKKLSKWMKWCIHYIITKVLLTLKNDAINLWIPTNGYSNSSLYGIICFGFSSRFQTIAFADNRFKILLIKWQSSLQLVTTFGVSECILYMRQKSINGQ